jgi:aspartate carbamoyltransferase catalytic subunit
MPSHLLSIADLAPHHISALFAEADAIRTMTPPQCLTQLAGSMVGLMFFQPSTRTRLGFGAAAQRLGARVLDFGPIENTRSVDYIGETRTDAARVMAALADLIVVRDFRPGSPAAIAAAVDVPVLNAGDGTNEHPSQALADMWLLKRVTGRLRGLRVGLVGDPGARTHRSFALGMTVMGAASLHVLSSRQEPGLPADMEAFLARRGIASTICASMEELLGKVDVVNMMPPFIPSLDADPKNLRVVPPPDIDRFVLTLERVRNTNADVYILHPGPRGPELDGSLDEAPNNLFFRQVAEGQYMRMALLRRLLSPQSAITCRAQAAAEVK